MPCKPEWFETTPFFQALTSLKKTKGNVTMALNEDAEVLTRIWCIFELWVTAKQSLKFRLATSRGVIGFGQEKLSQRQHSKL